MPPSKDPAGFDAFFEAITASPEFQSAMKSTEK